jgi:alkylation response protein AidB-like acyl-CoA dehydrogenase
MRPHDRRGEKRLSSVPASAPDEPSYMRALRPVITDVVAPAAAEVDRAGAFPRASIDALGAAGLLGLVSSADVGGLGQGQRAATLVVEALARHCASTALVVLVHYTATAALEAHAADDLREEIAAGGCLVTLAFSEPGSRSHFWVPLSTARRFVGGVRIDGQKSWVTSGGQADVYVWSTRPLRADGGITLWLLAEGAPGLRAGAPVDGLGLRGAAIGSLTASGLLLPVEAMLGADGGGFALLTGTVLPWLQLLGAGLALGTMESITAEVAHHVTATRLEHLGQTLAEVPAVRGQVARMRLRTDTVRALLLDALAAVEGGRDDGPLRVLEARAAAVEASIEVTELAMRVCGGAAIGPDLSVERRFRDARAAAAVAPTPDQLYDFIGRTVCGLPLFG